ncbi:alpha/beta hydrolase [Rhodococcus erythropolis]|uniref:alpha/beta hydrolase family protein n=1 Tax=Rhodococcus erythropolis TaxID=1833 RepID=UPI001E4FCC56|nr:MULTISPECIES: alpha/beta hydrolase family protein [Rhodococcus erythropolis group]MCD2105312.1 alpha/beta hydrolase [Rhodococcus qingshengii]MCZ4524084.1 alpha/beta hydrolase [Rhodococcus erythropolis]
MITIETQLATWFGSADKPLLGFVHVPISGTAREAVVMCPPLGKEHIDTYRGMRLLGEKLAARGMAAFRFEYAGVGDSAGAEDDPVALTFWLESIVSAVDYVRRAGAESVSIVGLRVGALLAASALEACGTVNSIVLWDPILTGRNYLREQRAFYAISVGEDDPTDSRVSIMGGVLAPECADQLSRLRITGPFLGRPHTLLAVKSSAVESRAVAGLAATLDPEMMILENHDAFTSPPSFYVDIPYDHIEELAEWVAEHAPVTSHAFTPAITTTARVAVTPSGDEVFESLERVGPSKLFAIRTHPAGTESPGGTLAPPTPERGLLFYTTAVEHRCGPGRSWVTIAREAAEHGVTSLRFDRRGVGDTGPIRADMPTAVYSRNADEDALAAVDALGADPKNLILAGLCSGGWTAASVALKVGARSTVLVDMILWSVRRKKSLVDAVLPEAPRAISDGEKQKLPFKASLKAQLQSRLPYLAWKLLGQRGITQVPEVLLDALDKKGVHATVVLSPADVDWFRQQRGPEGIARMARRGYDFDAIMAPVGDHPAYHRDLRTLIQSSAVSAVATQFGGSKPGQCVSRTTSGRSM